MNQDTTQKNQSELNTWYKKRYVSLILALFATLAFAFAIRFDERMYAKVLASLALIPMWGITILAFKSKKQKS